MKRYVDAPPEGWVPLRGRAEACGVSYYCATNAVADGRTPGVMVKTILKRMTHRGVRALLQWYVPPDVVFTRRERPTTIDMSGPLTDETWEKLIDVWDRYIAGEFDATEGERGA